MTTPTSDLLTEHFLKWQASTGERKKLKEFAAHLGMSPSHLNHYFTGLREPGPVMARTFATFFNDMRFYDAVGIPRPDKYLHYIERNWGRATLETQRHVAEIFATYSTEPLPTNGEHESETPKP